MYKLTYERVKTHASLLGHAAWLFISFFVLVGFPIIFGVEAYGKFAECTAVTFLVHKLVDLVSETNIIHNDVEKLISTALFSALIFSAPLLIAYYFFFLSATYIDLLLLSSLLVSSIVFNIAFQRWSPLKRLGYLIGFALISVAVCFLYWSLNSRDVALVLTTINFTGGFVGVSLIIRGVRLVEFRALGGRSLVRVLSSFWKMISSVWDRFFFASFSLFTAYGLLILAGPRLEFEDVGRLKLFLTFCTVGLFVTPVNPKELYRLATEINDESELFAFIRSSRALYFALFFAWLCAYVVLFFALRPGDGLFLVAASVYGSVMFTAVIDKVALSLLGLAFSARFILCFTAMAGLIVAFFGCDLDSFVICAGFLLVLYPICVLCVLRGRFYLAAIVPVGMSGVFLLISVARIYSW